MIGNALILFALLSAPPTDAARTMRYVGNAGFEISDGVHTVLLDFPYVSGAYGYMKFEASELEPRRGSLCLISHAHADHFNPEAVVEVGCQVAGPTEVMKLVPESARLPGTSPWKFEGATAKCIDSEHGGVDHCTLVLKWHETTFIAAGDVESIVPLIKDIPRPDIFVLPYWLANQTSVVREAFPGVRIVLSHEEPGASVDSCNGCVRLNQGDSIQW